MQSSTAAVPGVSLHEHLHNELCQLISVTPPTTVADDDDSVNADAAAADVIPKKSPRTHRQQKDLARLLLERSRHEGRRLNKLAVVNRLMTALCDDGGSNNTENDSNGGSRRSDRSDEGGRMNNHATHTTTPRIHGCVATHWELYPSIHPPTTNENEDEDEIEDDYVDAAVMNDKVNNYNDDTTTKEKSTINNNSNNMANTIIRGGGLRLPGLDFARTFRKGYTVLLWVRPMIQTTPSTTVSKFTKQQRRRRSSSSSPPSQRQILYRFATGIHDDDSNTNDNGGGKAVGVCAMIGQWRATDTTTAAAADSDNTNNENCNNCNEKQQQQQRQQMMTMLTATITAYTLPNNNGEIIQSRLYPPMAVSTKAKTPTTSISSSPSSSSSSVMNRSRSSSSSGSCGDVSVVGSNVGSAHARNMEQFQQCQQKQSQHSSNTTNNVIMTGAASLSSSVRRKKDDWRKDDKKNNISGADVADNDGKQETAPAATAPVQHLPPPNGGGVYVSSDITLPANEWSLIAIQHTHPYLRRPELLISVNGEEMIRGELGFPVLDATIIPPLGGSSSTDQHHNHHHHHGDVHLDDGERRRLRSMGILPECTLLDRAFDNGVVVKSRGNEPTTSTIIRQSCITHVHSVALLAGPPIPNSVLALVAERGPLTDYTSSSNGGLSFLLGPVSAIPQNRDAIVAPSAGYGYYGTASPDGGGGGTIGGGSGGHWELWVMGLEARMNSHHLAR